VYFVSFVLGVRSDSFRIDGVAALLLVSDGDGEAARQHRQWCHTALATVNMMHGAANFAGGT
jgi:hypothetical protein